MTVEVWQHSYHIKPHWWDDPEEPRCDECGIHTEEAYTWCGECGNCGQHCSPHCVSRFRFVNLYRVSRHYGGPEEGGWYFDVGEPFGFIEADNHEEAQRIAKALEPLYPPQEFTRFSVLGGDDIEIVVETERPARYPAEWPHYE